MRSDWLYPVASISYTAYLLQGITLNLFELRGWTSGSPEEAVLAPGPNVTVLPIATVAPAIAFAVKDWGLALLVVAINLGMGLVASVIVERPAMKLLYLLLPEREHKRPEGPGTLV